MTPKLSCIILNYNLKYLPRLCVEAIQRSRVNFPYEIIVVDNGSTDESLEYLRQMERSEEVRLVETGANLGYGKGNNAGAAAAKGEYLLILNPDVSVEPDLLQKMVDYLDMHAEVGVLAPQLFFFNGKIQDSCRRFMRPTDLIVKRTPLKRIPAFERRLRAYTMEDFDHASTQEVDFVTGACIMVPRRFFQEIGGFDPRYFMFMEDADLCRRIWEAGKKVVYFPAARALHYHKRLSGGSILWLLTQRMFWIHLASAGKYFWKWRGKPLPR